MVMDSFLPCTESLLCDVWITLSVSDVGCVPRKALIRAARAIREVKRSAESGVLLPEGEVDFPAIMQRLRRLRTNISPADGHPGTVGAGAHVYQGRGIFTGKDTIKGGETEIKFEKAVIATGGRNSLPNVDAFALSGDGAGAYDHSRAV
jgi:pyruvate/2-oxoglutarate dehydrogenase complex dihydrolipoamide dehydrogenase (E3) component